MEFERLRRRVRYRERVVPHSLSVTLSLVAFAVPFYLVAFAVAILFTIPFYLVAFSDASLIASGLSIRFLSAF